jgi:membrane protein
VPERARSRSVPAPRSHLLLRAVARVRRALRLAWRAMGRGVVEFYQSNNLTFAASIAYYTLLSLFPFALVLLSVLSRLALMADSPTNETLLHMIDRALPANFGFVGARLGEMAEAPLNLSLVGTLVTLWASMGVFGAVTSAVNHAWGVEQNYSFLKHKLVAFLMMLAAGLLAMTALLLVGAVQMVEANWFAAVRAEYPFFNVISTFVSRNAPTPIFILVVGLIYYFIPNARVRLRDVWFGAMLAGVLWSLAFAGFAWYVRDLSRFTVHGSVAAVVVFLIWVYLSAIILLYGVEVTAAYARLRKHTPASQPAAPPLEG